MANTTRSPRLIAELAPHSLQLVFIDGDNRVVFHRECALDAAAVAAILSETNTTAAAGNVLALLVPNSGFVLRANADEAASVRTVKSLLARAESAPHGLEAPLSVVGFDSVNGGRIDPVGTVPWVLALASTAQVTAAKEQLASLGLSTGEVRLALPAGVGAVVTALQDMPESTRVLVWQLGETNSQLACVSAGGCEAAGTVALGFEQVFEAVQAGLGLKFRAAATKLFFNPKYDFSDTTGAIAERIAALLRPAVDTLGCAPTALQISGLPAGQTWLAKAVAVALDIELFAPKLSEFAVQCGLKSDGLDPEPSASALGLFFQAAGTAKDAAWRSSWLDANAPVAVPAPAPKPVAAPAAAAAAVAAPAPVKPAMTPAPILKPVAKPVPVATGASAAMGATEAAPVLKPVIKPTPAPLPEKPKPIVAMPVVKAAAPAEPVVAENPVAEVVARPVEEPVFSPAEPAAKKKPAALIAAVAAVVVLGGAGAFFAMGGEKSSGNSDTAAAAAPALSADEIRMREVEEARMLADELKTPRSFRNERYSFEVSDRGFLRKLMGVGNRTLIDEFGWVELQGTITGTSTPFYAGTMGDTDYRTSINKTVREGKVVFEIKGVHPRFMMDTLVTCLPDKLKIETLFKPLNMQESRGLIAGTYMVKMNRQSLSLGQRAEVAPGAVSYSTQSGKVALKFNEDVWGQAGEAGKQTFMVGSNLVFFYFAGDGAPTGTKLSAELMLP